MFQRCMKVLAISRPKIKREARSIAGIPNRCSFGILNAIHPARSAEVAAVFWGIMAFGLSSLASGCCCFFHQRPHSSCCDRRLLPANSWVFMLTLIIIFDSAYVSLPCIGIFGYNYAKCTFSLCDQFWFPLFVYFYQFKRSWSWFFCSNNKLHNSQKQSNKAKNFFKKHNFV